MDEIITLERIPIVLKTYIDSINITSIPINTPEFRILVVILLFLIFMMTEFIIRLIFGAFGFIVSYQLYYTYSVRKAGDYTWGMIESEHIHIHHWLYCFIFLIVSWTLGIAHPIIIGLCSGGMAHGLQYSDWHIIKKN